MQKHLTGVVLIGSICLGVPGCDREDPMDRPPEPKVLGNPAMPEHDLDTATNARTPTKAEQGADEQAVETPEPGATAELEAAEGAEIEGEAKFYSTADGVRVVLEVEGAPPGPKGVHIHEKGDCSDIKGKSMGPHFAPQGDKHALPGEVGAGIGHLGDLGNIEVGEDGNGRLEIRASTANLTEGDRMSFMGKALVVHSGADSGKSRQPAGESGTPMACAIIKG